MSWEIHLAKCWRTPLVGNIKGGEGQSHGPLKERIPAPPGCSKWIRALDQYWSSGLSGAVLVPQVIFVGGGKPLNSWLLGGPEALLNPKPSRHPKGIGPT